jgi:hypothetical protein
MINMGGLIRGFDYSITRKQGKTINEGKNTILGLFMH